MKCLSAVLASFLFVTQAHAHAAHGKRHDVIKVMQENGCKISPELTQATLTKFKIETDDAVTMIGNLIAEGIVVFASDDKTLLLLPPECKE
ncbi:hypothetical protein [uncultured Sulfitobacter sp.]|uniref:hypothetical protein n=1 Tax=uncultured Sulfitobacter sp. TaxID=191468 RepID=UPI0026372B84|nr:hypothetical protein [uncultured Sulfitobacter sp.]